MRTFTARRRARRERLHRRVEFLDLRITEMESKGTDPRHDKQERSALLWALEELSLLDEIEAALHEPGLSDGERLSLISATVDVRHMPSDEDLERTPALARQYGGEEG